jgi:hypothetical protein
LDLENGIQSTTETHCSQTNKENLSIKRPFSLLRYIITIPSTWNYHFFAAVVEQHIQFEVEAVVDNKAVDIVEEEAVDKAAAADNSLETVHLVVEEYSIVEDFEGSLWFVDPLLFVKNEKKRRKRSIRNRTGFYYIIRAIMIGYLNIIFFHW